MQGSLSSPEDALFPGYLHNLVEAGFEEKAFIAFSKDTMNALQLAIQGIIGAKGGYLVYADYRQSEARILGLFLVRDTEGVVFRKKSDASGFDLDDTTYLDTDRLAMACRIHVDQFQNGQSRFIELIKYAKSQKEISEYFTNWIGLEAPVSSRELTHTFLELTSELPLPVNEENGQLMESEQFQEKVMNFALSSPERVIRLEDFNEAFYGEEPTTQRFIDENEIALDAEFRFDPNALKRYFNYRVSTEGITLSFSKSDLFSGKVSLEEDAIVIRSEALLKKLRKQLEKEEN